MRIARMIFLMSFAGLCYSFPVVAQAQSLQQLDKSYRQKSQESLDRFILSHKVGAEADTSNDTLRQLSAVINIFINHYSADTLSGRSPDATDVPGRERYVILQPRIKVCFVDTLILTDLLKPKSKRRSAFKQPLFTHKNVYHIFPTANYYEFPDPPKCKQWNYSVDPAEKGRFTVLRADTNLVHIVNRFLGVDSSFYGKKPGNDAKSAFLRQKMKLYASHVVLPNPSVVSHPGKKWLPVYYFNYGLYIDKVVFNQQMDQALIQFSFVNISMEAFYIRTGDQWVQKEYRTLSILD